MRKILALLYRSRIFLLFVLLEVVAFSWISQSRSYQRAVWVNSSNQVTGYVLEQTDHLKDYLKLRERNEQLAAENARLRGNDSSALFPLTVPVFTKVDSLNEVRYTFRPGEVINSSYLKARNYLTINRGAVHGIKPNMGIIGSNGIVGIIKDVSQHFSTAIPLINPSFRVSGRIKTNSFFGPVEWRGSDYRYAYLIDIPRYAAINVGDTVVTDSRSQLFPAGIPIGTIESYDLQEDQNFYAVKIRLTTDFASLDHVYIIEDKMKLEIQELENQTQE